MANQFLSQISLGTQAVLIYTGNGSPEGAETAPVGSIYLNATASNAANTLYVKGSGTGNTGWSLIASSTIPAGSDTEIQFNDSGVSAGDPQLTWNKTLNLLTVGSANNAGTLLVKNQGEIRFEEDDDNGSSYVSLKAPSGLVSNLALTLPGSLPEVNGCFLISSSSGVVEFSSATIFYNQSTGGIELIDSNLDFVFSVKDYFSSQVFTVGYESLLGSTATRCWNDFIINYSANLFSEDDDGDLTSIFSSSGSNFYFGPYDKNGVFNDGLDLHIRYGRGNYGSNSAIFISGVNYYIDVPLAMTLSPPAKTGATNPKLFSISGANANHITTVANDVNDISFNLSRNVQFQTGSSISDIRAIYINPPTYTATSSTQTISNASTLSISGSPVAGTNVVITNSYALNIESGKLKTAAATSSTAGFNIPHGTAPDSPVNGDIWTTTEGFYARINGSTVGPFDVSKKESFGIVISGNPITTGFKAYRRIQTGGIIKKVTVLADVSGSIVVDIKKCNYAGFPVTTSICASAKPTLSSAQKSEDVALTGWTTAFLEGDIFEFYVDSVSTVTFVSVIVDYEES